MNLQSLIFNLLQVVHFSSFPHICHKKSASWYMKRFKIMLVIKCSPVIQAAIRIRCQIPRTGPFLYKQSTRKYLSLYLRSVPNCDTPTAIH